MSHLAKAFNLASLDTFLYHGGPSPLGMVIRFYRMQEVPRC